MHNAISAFALLLNIKNKSLCAVSLVRVFFRKKIVETSYKHLNSCHGDESVSYDQNLDNLSEKLNSRLLVQEEHGFQKGAPCAPLATGDQKKPGLDR